jgi:hypothetical protein
VAFDLQKMLHRKGELESARLDDFPFGIRARMMRMVRDEMEDPSPVRLA